MKKFMNNAGFTLVELIVVIAILGILAAVAVPAYTGYLDKANEAADTQVVSAMNTAFAAACVENGESNTGVTATCTPASDNTVDAVVVTHIGATAANASGTDAEKAADATATKIEAAFVRYFDSNNETVLKYYKSFDFEDGNFVGSPEP